MIVALFFTEVILLEIRNGVWVAKVNGTSTDDVVAPAVATT